MPIYAPLDLGPLPIEAINAALRTELAPGRVRLSGKAHRHIAIDHAADYPICFRALPRAISAPSFVGQAPGHAENFEMVLRVSYAGGRAVLVAVGLEPDRGGNYRVKSSYLISQKTLNERRRAGRLVPILGII